MSIEFFCLKGRVSSKQSNFFFGSNRNKPKLDLFRLFFGLFRETKNIIFGLFWCFGSVQKQPKQTEFSRNKPKKSPKNVLYLGVLETVIFFFSVRTETNRNSICYGGFRFAFLLNQKIIFSFFFMFRTGIETTETNRTYSMGN